MKNKRSNLFIFILALCCGLIEGRKEAFRAFSYGHGKSFDKNQRSKTDSSWDNGHKIPFVYGAFLPEAMSHSIKSDLQSFDLLDCKGQKTVPEKFGVHRLGAQHRFGIRYFNKIFSLTPYVLTHPGIILEQNSGHGQALQQNATFTPDPIWTPDENQVKQIQHTEQPEIGLQDFSDDLNGQAHMNSMQNLLSDAEQNVVNPIVIVIKQTEDIDRISADQTITDHKNVVAQKNDLDDKDGGAPVAAIVLIPHNNPIQPAVSEAPKSAIKISHAVNEDIDPAPVWTADYDPITPTYAPITPTFILNKREEAGPILNLTVPAATPIADPSLTVEDAAAEEKRLAKEAEEKEEEEAAPIVTLITWIADELEAARLAALAAEKARIAVGKEASETFLLSDKEGEVDDRPVSETPKSVIKISRAVNEGIDPALVWTADYDPITPTYAPITPTFILNKREEAGPILNLTVPAATPIADEKAAAEAAEARPYVLTHPGIIPEQNSGHGQALQQNATFTPDPILTPDEKPVKQIQNTEQPEIGLQDFSKDLNEQAHMNSLQNLLSNAEQNVVNPIVILNKKTEDIEKISADQTITDNKNVVARKNDLDDKNDGAPVGAIVLTEHDQPTQALVHEAKEPMDERIDTELVWEAEYSPIFLTSIPSKKVKEKHQEVVPITGPADQNPAPIVVEAVQQRIVERISEEGRNLFLVEKHGAQLDDFQQKDPNFQGQQIYFVTKEDLSNAITLNVFIKKLLINKNSKSSSLVKLLGDENEVTILQLHEFLEKIINDYKNNNLEKLLFTKDSLPFLKSVFALMQKIGTFYNQSNDESKKNLLQLLDNPIIDQLICQKKSIKKDLSGNTFTAENEPYLAQYDGNQLAAHHQWAGPTQKPLLTQKQPLARQQLEQQMPLLLQNRKVQLLNQKQPSQHIANPTSDWPKKIGESIKELPQQKADELAAEQQRIAQQKAQLEEQQRIAKEAEQQRIADLAAAEKARKKQEAEEEAELVQQKAQLEEQQRKEEEARLAELAAEAARLAVEEAEEKRKADEAAQQRLEQQQIVEQKRKADELAKERIVEDAAEEARKNQEAKEAELAQQRIALAQLEKKLADEEAELAKQEAEQKAAEEARKKQEAEEEAELVQQRIALAQLEKKLADEEAARLAAKEAEQQRLEQQQLEQQRKEEEARLAEEEKRLAKEAELAKQEADELAAVEEARKKQEADELAAVEEARKKQESDEAAEQQRQEEARKNQEAKEAELAQQRLASAQLEKKLADEEARIAALAAKEAEEKRKADEEAAEQQRIASAQLEKKIADEAAARLAQLEQQRIADLAKQEAEQQRIADLAKQEADEEDAEGEAAAEVAGEKRQQEPNAQVMTSKQPQFLNRADAKEAEEADAADEESDEKAQTVPNFSLDKANNPFGAAADEEVKEAAEDADLENQDAYGKKASKNEKTHSKGNGLASRNNSLILKAPEQSDNVKGLRPNIPLANLLQMSYNVQVQNQNPPDNVQLQRQVGPKGKNRNAPAGKPVLEKTNTKPNKQQADELAAELEEQQRQEEARKKQQAAQLKAQQQVMVEARIVRKVNMENMQQKFIAGEAKEAEKKRKADEAEQQRLVEVRETQEKLKADKEAQKKLAVQVAQQQKADLEEKQRIAKEAAAAVKLAQAQTRRVKQKAGEKRKADKLKAEELVEVRKNQEKRKANKKVYNKQKADLAAVQLEKNLADLAAEQLEKNLADLAAVEEARKKQETDEEAAEEARIAKEAEEKRLADLAAAEEARLAEVRKKRIADDQLKAQLAAAQQKLLIQEPDSNQIESRIIESRRLEESKDDHDNEITQQQEEVTALTNCFELRNGKIFQLVLKNEHDPKYTHFINSERTNWVGKIKEKARRFVQKAVNTDISSLKQNRTLGHVQDTFAAKILDINGFTISPTTSDKTQEVIFIGAKCMLYKKDGKYRVKNNEEGAEFKDYNITPPKKEVMFLPQVMFSQQNIKGESKDRGCCTTGNGSRPNVKPKNFMRKNFVLKREGVGICLTEWEYNAEDLKNDLKNDRTNWDKIGDWTGTFKMNTSLTPDGKGAPYPRKDKLWSYNDREIPVSEMRGGVESMARRSPYNGGGQTSPVQRVFGLEIQNVSASATGSENSSGKKSSATGNDHSSAEKIQKKIGNTQNIQTVKNAEKFVNKITDEVKLRKSILRNVR